uniref:Uncharacterized protein n=1 Tax=Nelumbo nucifera TaxID=4432 RepID=A0A822XCS1_NELNU|nr:TPA_asm: hypothetical protein HUJ06_019593 [Nelumbo nucifera]
MPEPTILALEKVIQTAYRFQNILNFSGKLSFLLISWSNGLINSKSYPTVISPF